MWLAFVLYDALSSDLALFVPASYCRLMLGEERLLFRVPLAVAFGLLTLWLFSWRTGDCDWTAFNTVMGALGASLLRSRHVSALGQLLASPKSFLLLSGGVGVLAAVGRPLAYYLFPISELALAYSTAELFAGAALEPAAARLALISITSQLPLGVVSTSNLRAAQRRKNALLTVGKEGSTPLSARGFTRVVWIFIAFTAVPFFFQRSVVESINAHATIRFIDSVENSMRLHAVLRSGASLSAAVADETIDSQASHLRQVLTTSHRLLERKLFTLPRLALLPGALVGHPIASAAGMAIAVAFDGAKAKAVAFITSRIESLTRESRKLSSMRSRVEAHDSQNAMLLRGARAEAFTRAHWQDLTLELQDVNGRTRALEGVRMWIRWLFWQDVIVSACIRSQTHKRHPQSEPEPQLRPFFHVSQLPGVECWVAYLLEAGHIHVAEVMVYTRAFDDAIDVVLMRSKAEAELERLKSDAARLAALHTALAASTKPAGPVTLRVTLAPPTAPTSSHGRVLRLHGIGFSRGVASVAIDNLELPVPGIYAIAGPNGVGKSSLFALLGACQEAFEVLEVGLPAVTAVKAVDPPSLDGRVVEAQETDTEADADAVVAVLPAGLQLTRSGGTVLLPRGKSDKRPMIVEVGQRAYTPLYTRPIDWLRSSFANTTVATRQRGADAETRAVAARVAALAVELRLGLGERSGEDSGTADNEADMALSDDDPFVVSLLSEHEDYGSTMSGGQRVKLELIRSVFLGGACPDVLLLDEAFAPLDPSSKLLIMRRLRTFCSASLVLVIYHANARDMGTDQAVGNAMESGAHVDTNGSTGNVAVPNALDVCSEGGGSFFDGVVQFSDDGNATFDPAAGRCS